MSTAGRLKYAYLAYFSKPACDRVLYRDVRRRQSSKLLVIGLPATLRAQRLMQVAADVVAADEIHFAAIDLFEARPADQGGLALKDAYRIFKASGRKVQLIPGDPASALARSANALGQRDLIVISADFDESAIGSGWFYVPRMLHTSSRVYLETCNDAGGVQWRLMPPSEIERLAAAHRPRKAA